MRGYNLFLIILSGFGLSLLTPLGLIFGFAFALISLPVFYLLLALPGIALGLSLARILDLMVLRRFLPHPEITGVAAVVLVAACSVGIAFVANQTQHAELVALQSGDHDDLRRPLPDATYAYLSDDKLQSCTDFCQRLLLTGQASAVLVAQAEVSLSPDPATLATLWAIQDSPDCPELQFPENADRMRIEGEAKLPDPPRADTLIRSGVAAGHCLIGTSTTLAAADVVIVDDTLRAATTGVADGLSLGSDLIDATRYAVWLKSANTFTEQARWTYVSAQKMFPMAVPSVTSSYLPHTFEARIGFARVRATGFAYDPGFDKFVDQTLGLRLSLAAVPNPVLENGEDPLLAALKTPDPLPANIVQLADGKVRAMMNAKGVTPADRAVFLALLADPRMALQWGYEGATATLLREAPADFVATLAKIGFARMNGLLLPDQHGELLGYQEKYALLKRVNPVKAQIGFIGDLLAQLPDAALQPYGPAIFALAKDRENRTEPYKLLIRLNAFGDPGAQALVDLLAAAADRSDKDAPLYRNHWQHAYLAAMIGLCQMGPKAAPVLPQILTLAESGAVDLSSGPYGRMTLVTLIRLGQPVDAIHSLAARQQYPISTELIDYAVLHASDLKACYF